MLKLSDIVAKLHARFVARRTERFRESCCTMHRCVGRHEWLMSVSFLTVVLGFGLSEPALSQSSKAKTKGKSSAKAELSDDLAKYVAPLTGEESPIASNKTITVYLNSGKVLTDMTVTEALLGTGDESLKFLSVADADGKKKQKLAAALIGRIHSGEHDYDLVFDPGKKGPVLIDVTTRDADVNERLKSHGQRIWPEQTDEERAKTIADYKDFLKRVQANYQFPTQLHETQFFLFLTDLPANQVGQQVANLDSMYAKLCDLFGVPKTKNLFLGKCIIVAFATEESFLGFELKFLDNPKAKGAQGLSHGSSDGRQIIACYRGGGDAAAFGALLVHETTHSFAHRFRSNAVYPKWIGEGLADWIAYAVVPRKYAVDRQKKSVERVQKSGSLGGNFLDQNAMLEDWQYDMGSHLINYLVQLDPGRFRAFLINIKEGDTPEEALGRSYGLTYPELLTQYGRSIGVAKLQP